MDVKQETHLDSWSDFERALEALYAEYNKNEGSGKSTLLFRGQSDANWPLSTTLERRQGTPSTFQGYANWVRATLPQVQTLTSKDWPDPGYSELASWGTEYDHGRKLPPGYEYYVYLRHHGFPSPLLDWTRSPYVAAFFAFRASAADRVAIYAYLEFVDGAKIGSSDRPQIKTFGPYIKSHQRHVLQQCEYTLSATFKEREWRYVPHADVFALGEKSQDSLWKFTIPAAERLSVLRRLDLYNLNAYSLFLTEDALLETVALRELEFNRRHRGD